jgi:uncharacterized protein (UPF0303 family)
MTESLEALLAQEESLQFERFDESTAWEIGSWLVGHARRAQLPVTIDITRAGHQLFHAALPGTAVDNDEWIKRKVRLVSRVGHSSFYVGRMLAALGARIEEALLLPESEYAAHGGCFPVRVRGTGLVGTIAVSGLPQEQDHALVVLAIRAHLGLDEDAP